MAILEVLRDNGPEILPLPDPAVIGKSPHCEIRLRGWFVAREHARLFRGAGGWVIEDLGGGVQLNGKRVERMSPVEPECDNIQIAGHVLRVRSETLTTDEGLCTPEPSVRPETETPIAEIEAPADFPDGEWQARIHGLLLQRMDLRRKDIARMSDDALREETGALIGEILADLRDQAPAGLDLETLGRRVLDEAIGYGPLEDLLADESISEIMVNRHDEIFVERGGRLVRHPLTFSSNRAVMAIIERIVAPIGRRIDESSPMVDARLRDGSRVNAVIPPLALKGPTLTIRKFSRRRLDRHDLVGFGSLSPAMAEFLRLCVEHKKNIVVSGGTGSGKTTLLNVLSNVIPHGERVVTIEDAAELQLDHDHLVSLESRPANSEGKGLVAIRDLVRNALRMRPDRIVIGECRGSEALDMLQAMNTGHEGSLTTLHANTPRDALSRLETMVMMAGMDLPVSVIREQVSSAVDIIVQQTRFACGARKITYITEITGMEGGRIQAQDLFRFRKTGHDPTGRVIGSFEPAGIIPGFYEELMESGQRPDLSLFRNDQHGGVGN